MGNTGESSRVKRSNGITKKLFAAFAVALVLYAIPLVVYWWNFGSGLTASHEKWGQFGDYIGGFLNPLFALLAFLAVLLSLWMQRTDFINELDYLKHTSKKEEAHRIILGISEEIEKVLEIDVGTGKGLTIRTLTHEAKRQREMSPKVSPYSNFIINAKDPEQFIGAHYLRLKYLVTELHHYLSEYNKLSSGEPTYVVDFFTRKTMNLIQMLDDIERLDADLAIFFRTQGGSLGKTAI